MPATTEPITQPFPAPPKHLAPPKPHRWGRRILLFAAGVAAGFLLALELVRSGC